MTDPSKERIAAALRLAEAVTEWSAPGFFPVCPPSDDEHTRIHNLVAEALVAYRATLPRIRSRAEVDGEIATVIRDYHQHITRPGWKESPDWDSFSVGIKNDLNRLCAEPTDSGPSSVDTPDPPPVPVSPAGADLSIQPLPWHAGPSGCHIYDADGLHVTVMPTREMAQLVATAVNASGPPGVAAAKESTDNAAALEGAALDFHKRVAEALGLSDGDQGSYIYADEERCLLEIRDNRRDAEQWNEHQLNTAADAESHGCDSGVEKCSCEEALELRVRLESAENELRRLGHGVEPIFVFKADGTTLCTSLVGDASWDTKENRRRTFDFIRKAKNA